MSIVGHCQYTPCTSLAHGEEDISAANRLYFGDCLEVMRENIPEESVDLIYLDPPFNSKRLYNAFIGGAQWVAFDDTWRWHEAIEDFDQVAGRPRYKGIMEGLRMMLGEDSQLAYMANRLVECHRVLKPTGSIYLHCDPTMSHYLKAVMDGIFGRRNFRNEVIWAYRGGGVPKHDFARRHDVSNPQSHSRIKVSLGLTGGLRRHSKPIERYPRTALTHWAGRTHKKDHT